jgi:hypothetical protein
VNGIEFDNFVDWSGLGPGSLQMNDSEVNNFSDLSQPVFGYSAQDWTMHQYSQASTSYSHQPPLDILQFSAANEESLPNMQHLMSVDIAGQSSIQESTTFSWPGGQDSAIILPMGAYSSGFSPLCPELMSIFR